MGDDLDYLRGQQSALAEFGMIAMRTRDIDAMLQSATVLCARGMRTDFAKVMPYRRETDDLIVTAGTGWRPGVVGVVTMAANADSIAGYAFQTGELVISNHLSDDTRFRTPRFMIEHGVQRAINVLIESQDERWGVLEVDSSDPGSFDAEDQVFMQGFANLIGVAIERKIAEDALHAAIVHQELLTREASHRVKNSLAMVASMLSMQSRRSDLPAVASALGEAEQRIGTIAVAHDRLWQSKTIGSVDLADYVGDLCARLQHQSPAHVIACHSDAVELSADIAIPLGLLATELVTNAIKYAYPDAGGAIRMSVKHEHDTLVVEIADDGVGLPADFDLVAPKTGGFGSRMVAALVRQLHASVAITSDCGARIVITVPLPA